MEFSGCGFKAHSGQHSMDTSKNPSVVNTILCISSFHYTHDLLKIQPEMVVQ